MSRSRVHHYFALPWRMSGGRCARFFAQHTALYLGSHSLCQLVLSFTLQVCLWAGSQTFLQLSRELGQQLLVQNSFIDVPAAASSSIAEEAEVFTMGIWTDIWEMTVGPPVSFSVPKSRRAGHMTRLYIHTYIHSYIHTYIHALFQYYQHARSSMCSSA